MKVKFIKLDQSAFINIKMIKYLLDHETESIYRYSVVFDDCAHAVSHVDYLALEKAIIDMNTPVWYVPMDSGVNMARLK